MLKVNTEILDKQTNLPTSTGGMRVTTDMVKGLGDEYQSPFGILDPFDSINFRDIYKDDISKMLFCDIIIKNELRGRNVQN